MNVWRLDLHGEVGAAGGNGLRITSVFNVRRKGRQAVSSTMNARFIMIAFVMVFVFCAVNAAGERL